ncbi:MAG: DUF1778 domain-containing protein [Rhodoferax sp.]|uniref:type II toxin-antitoxin system TacA family antitoxin n=1 Tax=Rhodoferax sp. TaxID=50421 RepID=UPI0013FEFD70|nr:DUF1778 domain-containing protein [Rhodoferax sp.]NDP39135.1 DUF1778 domain-containing protein [Rhodoferax sp.]
MGATIANNLPTSAPAPANSRPAPRVESARINLRTSPEAKALIERAAALMGSTVSSFMLQNAYEAASRVLAQQEIITLSDRDRDAFLKALDNPSEPTQALIDLMRLNQ